MIATNRAWINATRRPRNTSQQARQASLTDASPPSSHQLADDLNVTLHPGQVTLYSFVSSAPIRPCTGERGGTCYSASWVRCLGTGCGGSSGLVRWLSWSRMV